MKRVLLAICILASGNLIMSLAEASPLAPAATNDISTLFLLGSGLLGLGSYGRRRFKK